MHSRVFSCFVFNKWLWANLGFDLDVCTPFHFTVRKFTQQKENRDNLETKDLHLNDCNRSTMYKQTFINIQLNCVRPVHDVWFSLLIWMKRLFEFLIEYIIHSISWNIFQIYRSNFSSFTVFFIVYVFYVRISLLCFKDTKIEKLSLNHSRDDIMA